VDANLIKHYFFVELGNSYRVSEAQVGAPTHCLPFLGVYRDIDPLGWGLIYPRCDENLAQYLIREMPKLTVRRAIQLMLQVAEGIKVIHQQRMIHRDIKLENILVRKSANPDDLPTLLIGDWGSATLRQYAITNIFTPRYAAPEMLENAIAAAQLMGHQQGYTEQVDIWSLGLTLVELSPKPELLRVEMNPNDGITIPLDRQTWPPLRRVLVTLLAIDPLNRPPATVVVARLKEILPSAPESLGRISPVAVCIIDLEAPRNARLPCGHCCVCQACAMRMLQGKAECPLCRKPFTTYSLVTDNSVTYVPEIGRQRLSRP